MKNTRIPPAKKLLSRHAIKSAVVVGAIVALPIGLVAAPATAEPVRPADYAWQQDCDHTGPPQWQQNRSGWEWGNCDNANGHWEWRGDRDHGQWQWHRDRPAPPPPPPMFGSL
ncbi:hypothetical protein [Rhodococcus sp. NPDC127528]|uniref:hypothetical protein n=1 Tax=unclassified Rhodococcus (in: high G+C Gram-positive bacteria) TaxID=192944 RepID=UPI00364033DE